MRELLGLAAAELLNQGTGFLRLEGGFALELHGQAVDDDAPEVAEVPAGIAAELGIGFNAPIPRA